jgi:hypothetical protein
VPPRVVVEQADRAVAVPDAQRLGLVLAFPVRELDLEDDVTRRNRERRERVPERLLEPERPPLGAFLEDLREPREPLAPRRTLLEPG